MLPSFLTHPDPSIYLDDNYLVLDFETTNIRMGSPLEPENRLLLACWRYNGESKSEWGGEYDMEHLLSDIQRASFLVAHNAKFELGWLLRCGTELREVLVYDTLLAEWVLLGNTSMGLQDLGLQVSCERRGVGYKETIVSTLISSGVSPLNIPEDWLEEYCHTDVAITEALFLKQRELLREKQLLHIQYSRCLLTPVLTEMEFNGLSLDKDRVQEEFDKARKELEQVQFQLNVMAKKNGYEGINWRSGKQVAEYLYDILKFEEVRWRGEPLRTAKGARKTDVATIESLKATNKKQREFVELYKQVGKLSAKLSKNLNFFQEVCTHHNGNFRGILNQGTTKTHRLSSSGLPIVSKESGTSLTAQLQNIPREFKRLFKARREGWQLFEADGSQLEFRVAAILTGDEVAIEEIINEVDVHQITADYLTEEGEATSRQDAKSRTFRPLFAGSSGTPAEQAYCKFFQNKYHQMYKVQTGWTYEVLDKKSLRTPYGMLYYWPHCKMQGSGYITHTTEIFNCPIQGLATAEIIPIAIVFAWHRLRDMQVKLTLTVHDSVIGEKHRDVDDEQLRKILAQSFTIDVYNFLEACYNYSVGRCPLGCGIKIGEHWGEGVEYTAVVNPLAREDIVWSMKDKTTGTKKSWTTTSLAL